LAAQIADRFTARGEDRRRWPLRPCLDRQIIVDESTVLSLYQPMRCE